MSGSEIVLSILATVITALIGIIISLVLKGQTKFETRMDKHVHDLRSDLQTCNSQLLVLRTVLIMQLPPDLQEKVGALFKEKS